VRIFAGCGQLAATSAQLTDLNMTRDPPRDLAVELHSPAVSPQTVLEFAL
jgi:hypothetical protein